MTHVPGSDPAPGASAVPRLAFDVARLAIAVGAGIVAAAITFLVLWMLRGQIRGDVAVTCLFAFSAASSITYLIHTLRIFTRLDAARLKTVLLATNPHGRFGRVGAVISGTGPTIAVQWSIIAIAAVLVFTLWPGLLAEPVTVALSVIVVAASWGVTLIAYGVHYARFDAATEALGYPGDTKERVFVDYLYLAAQVQTTFSSSDVSLLTPAARSLVTGHTLVSFAFNTVIIAMLITVLFLGQGGS